MRTTRLSAAMRARTPREVPLCERCTPGATRRGTRPLHRANCIGMKLKGMTQAMTHPRRQKKLLHSLHKVRWPFPPFLKDWACTAQCNRWCRHPQPLPWTGALPGRRLDLHACVVMDSCPPPSAHMWLPLPQISMGRRASACIKGGAAAQ
jgi:hypothetical protein